MRRNRVSLLVLAATLVSACRDQSLVAPSAPGTDAVSTDAATASLATIQRVSPLTADVVARATLGATGGTIKLPSVGLLVTVPKGALATATTITVTAPAGSNVAYLFQPHGLVFAQPARIEQDLGYVTVGAIPQGVAPVAGYVADEHVVRAAAPGASLEVLEVLPATVDARRGRVSFTVSHFSGYLVSSGIVSVPASDTRVGGGR